MPTMYRSAGGLCQFLLYSKLLLLERCDEKIVWRGSGRFISDPGLEPGMFGVKCGNMACVHLVLLSHCDNGQLVDHS